MINYDALDSLYNGIEIFFRENIKNLPITRFVEGSVISVSGNICTVKINEQNINFPIRSGLILQTNDIVYVCYPNGSMSDGFIDLKKP